VIIEITYPVPRVALFRINDPEHKNALTPELTALFPGKLEEIRRRDDLSVVVVAGVERWFSVGADFRTLPALMAEVGGGDPVEVRKQAVVRLYSAYRSLETLPQVTIAAVRGSAVGGGLGIALWCDIRIVGENTKLGANFSRLGIHPGMGISYRLVQLLGEEIAGEILYTGRIFTGKEAERIGLALKAVPEEEVEKTALALGEEIARSAPLSVRAIKKTLLSIRKGASLEEILVREAEEQIRLGDTEDAREGIMALYEKRSPLFRGR
jgi:enoyl-CoA hydratase/carnithine racemase